MEPEFIYDKLIKKMNSYHPHKDFVLVEKAYELASSAHENQKRRSGEPYIIHPLEVAVLLADLELDIESIVGGILHDIIEDTEYTYNDICNLFSEEVAIIVDGVTKLGELRYSTPEEFSRKNLIEQKAELQAESYRHMFLSMARDIRVILIKLADRLHNMRTLKYMSPEKQREKAQETLDIYAPIAHRLGISKFQKELEDLSLCYLNPAAYYELAEKINLRHEERKKYILGIVDVLSKTIFERNIHARVEGRSKHFFSIYKKMVDKEKTLDEIYDLFAVRVIVDDVSDCYTVLGIVHELYRPLPSRFKDYISLPKPNKYKSIHDTLIGPSGEPFEVQIRTWEMHRTAELGIAAHWRYKSKSGNNNPNAVNSAEAKLSWLREILKWQRELSSNKEFLDVLKTDLDVYKDEIYAFTPRGEVINLPKGSTPIDFAYMIHSSIGNKMVGARANHKQVTIDYQIKNGDRIEILTSQNSKGPSRDWLSIVKSTQARQKINQWFRNEFKEDNILKGKDLIDKYIKQHLNSDSRKNVNIFNHSNTGTKKSITASDILRPEWMEIVIQKYGFRNWDAVCAAIGHGGLKEGQVVNRLVEELLKEKRKNQSAIDILAENQRVSKDVQRSANNGIIISGVPNADIRLPKCCNPVPGDEIIGFVTRGRGVTVHRTDCPNIINISPDEKNRLIEIEWNTEDSEKNAYYTEIRIDCNESAGMISDISSAFNQIFIPVKSLNAQSINGNIILFQVTIEIRSKEQLEKVFKKIKNVPGVINIERVI